MANKKFPLSIEIKAIDSFSKSFKSMTGKMSKWYKDNGGKAMSMNLAASAHSMKKFGNSVAVAGRQLAATGTLVGGTLFAITKSTADYGDNVAKAATRLGIGVEALQEFRFAADRSGVAAKTFDMAFQRFGRRVGDLASGKNSPLGKAIEQLNGMGHSIDLMDANGQLKSNEQLFTEYAEALSKVEDPAIRNSLAMAAFDSEGVKLVQMLGDGSEGINALREEARALGLVMSEDAAKGSEGFVDALTDAGYAMQGVKNILGAQLMPAIQPLVKAFKDFVVNNRDQIEAFGKTLAEMIPTVDELKVMFKRFQEGMSSLYKKIEPVVNLLGGEMNTILIALGSMILFPVIAAFGSMALAFFAVATSLGPLMGGLMTLVPLLKAALLPVLKSVMAAILGISAPIALAVAAVTALAVGGYMLIKHWDKVKEFFAGLFSFIGDGFRNMAQGITSILPKGLQKRLGFGGTTAPLHSGDASSIGGNVDHLYSLSGANSAKNDKSEIIVDFKNMPKGVRVDDSAKGGDSVNINQGFAMAN